MFPFASGLLSLGVLLISVTLWLFGYIPAIAVVVTFALAAVAVFGLLMLDDPGRGMRRAGICMLAVVAIGVAFAIHLAPAHASAAADISGALITRPASLPAVTSIAAPPGDDGFWSGLNGYLAEGVAAIVAAFAAWALKEIATRTRFKLRTEQEAQIRETMKTGAFAAMSELELQIDKRWTPAQRQAVLAKVVAWAQERAAAQLRKLGLPAFVVNAMASKVVGSLVDAYPFLEVGEVSPATPGNPGSTPALDRAVGGNGGN